MRRRGRPSGTARRSLEARIVANGVNGEDMVVVSIERMWLTNSRKESSVPARVPNRPDPSR